MKLDTSTFARTSGTDRRKISRPDRRKIFRSTEQGKECIRTTALAGPLEIFSGTRTSPVCCAADCLLYTCTRFLCSHTHCRIFLCSSYRAGTPVGHAGPKGSCVSCPSSIRLAACSCGKRARSKAHNASVLSPPWPRPKTSNVTEDVLSPATRLCVARSACTDQA